MRRWLLASLLAFLGWHQAMPQLQPLLMLEGVNTSTPVLDISEDGMWMGVAAIRRANPASVNSDFGVKIWNLGSGETFFVSNGGASVLRFAPNTNNLVVLAPFNHVTVYTPTHLASWRWHPIARFFIDGWDFDVAPQLSALAVVDAARRVRLLRGLRLDVLTPEPPSVHTEVAFSPDGTLLAVMWCTNSLANESEVRLYRLQDLAVVWARQVPFVGTAIAFAPNGRYLAAAGEGGQIRLWDLSTNQEWDVAARAVSVRALRFSPDSTLLATAEGIQLSQQPRSVRLWSVPNLALQAEIPVDNAPISLAFHAPQNQLYVSCTGGAIDAWTLQPPYQSQPFARYWYVLGFRRDSRELWLSDGTYFYIYDGNGQLLQRFPAWVQRLSPFDGYMPIVSPDRQWYVGDDGIRRAQDHQLVIPAPAVTAAFSPDSTKVAISHYGENVVYDLRTAQPIMRFTTGGVAGRLQFSADGTRILYVRMESYVADVYDVSTGQVLWRSPVPFDEPSDVALSPDGSLVAIRALDVGVRSRLKVYRVSDGSLVFDSPYYGIDEGFAFSPNSRYLVIGIGTSAVCYDLLQNQVLWEEEYTVMPDFSSESFTPDSQYVVLANSRTPVVVDVRTGRTVATLGADFSFPVVAARYSDDGMRIVVQYEDSTVALYRHAPVHGDANLDGCVNNADLLIVLFNFGTSFADADFNRDGIVNNADLLIVLLNFGNGC